MLNDTFLWFTPSPMGKFQHHDGHIVWMDDSVAQPYYPLREYPALFMAFSEIERKGFMPYGEELIRSYGPLLLGGTPESRGIYKHFHVGEKAFERELLRLSFYVYIWRTLRNDAIDAGERHSLLGQRYRISGDVFEKLDPFTLKWTEGLNCSDWRNENGFYDCDNPESELVLFARTQLRDAINDQLYSRVSVDLATVTLNGEHQYTQTLRPDSLLAALWLQFADAITEDHVYDTCDQCGGWFKKITRREQRFCSPKCKMRAYRAG